MAMHVSSLQLAPGLRRVLHLPERKPSGPRLALEDLLSRIRQRRYPETTPVLASYWLKTVHSAGYNLAWWSYLHAGIASVLAERPLDPGAVESLQDIQTWIRQEILGKHKAPEPQPPAAPPFRPDLNSTQAAVYVSRLLNEWLPREVAHLLTDEMEYLLPDSDGMPGLAVGKAIERLLHRERFSARSLELLLGTATVHAYPAHVEILRDVVLSMLGRTSSPAPLVLPATLLAFGGRTSAAAADFADAVNRAFLHPCGEIEELYVPLQEAQTMELLSRDPVRIGSIVVTADGRWWQSVRLQGPAESAIVFRPGGVLHIDFGSDRAGLVVPWPDADADWRGNVRLPHHLEIFGREWRGRAWERNAGGACLHLDFLRCPTAFEAEEHPETRGRGLRPASIEMAWSEVEQALLNAQALRSTVPIDQLRREDLIPLARAILRLADSVLRLSLHRREEIERSLLSIRYHHGAVAREYGRIPWRVLPAPLRDSFRKRRLDPRFESILAETFEESPGPFTGRSSPPRAA